MKYEFTILKKVRSKLIACFSSGNFSIPEDYTLSSAVENNKIFTAKSIIGKGKEGILFQLQNQLGTYFNGSVSSKIQGNTLVIDVHKLYEDIAKDIQKPEEPLVLVKEVLEETEVADTDSVAEIPEPIGPFGEKILSFLKERFLTDAVIKATEVNFSETKDQELKIKVKEYSVPILWQILKALEENSEFSNLLYYEPCTVVVKKGKVNTEARKLKTLLNSFLTELSNFTAKHKLPFALKTPVSVAISENPIKLSIVAEDRPATFTLFNILLSMGTNWYPELQEDVIKITLRIEDMHSAIEKGITGPLPQNIPLGNIQEEVLKQGVTKAGVYRKDEPRIVPQHKILKREKTTAKQTNVAPKTKSEIPKDQPKTTIKLPEARTGLPDHSGKGIGMYQTGVDERGNPIYSYVYTTKDYDSFHFLDFNRKTKKRHVAKVKASILFHGVIGFVTVAITDIFDGTEKMWIADGQHRFKALKELGWEIGYLVTKNPIKTKEDMVRLIADLNNSSKGWSLDDYLTAWISVYEELYGFIKDLRVEKKLPLITLVEVFSGLSANAAKESFKGGRFKIKDKDTGNTYVERLMELKCLLPFSSQLYSGFILFFRRTPDYDNNQMIRNIKKLSVPLRVEPNEKREVTMEKIAQTYTMAA